MNLCPYALSMYHRICTICSSSCLRTLCAPWSSIMVIMPIRTRCHRLRWPFVAARRIFVLRSPIRVAAYRAHSPINCSNICTVQHRSHPSRICTRFHWPAMATGCPSQGFMRAISTVTLCCSPAKDSAPMPSSTWRWVAVEFDLNIYITSCYALQALSDEANELLPIFNKTSSKFYRATVPTGDWSNQVKYSKKSTSKAKESAVNR